ncbi:MAG: fumarylacetoacetate hydrolase family protein, partial [Thermoanaerobaculia bacterium]
MKIYRYEHKGHIFWGKGQGESVTPVGAGSAAEVPTAVPAGDPLSLSSVRILNPVVPTKIVAVGRNYAEHAKELGNEAPPEPILFLKPPSSLNDPGGRIEMPPQSSRVDYEGELAVAIGRRARRVRASEWRQYVLGFS